MKGLGPRDPGTGGSQMRNVSTDPGIGLRKSGVAYLGRDPADVFKVVFVKNLKLPFQEVVSLLLKVGGLRNHGATWPGSQPH